VKAVIAAMPAYFWMSLQTMFMYRAEMILWAIWGIVYPAVALAMWTAAIAGSADGQQIGTFAARDFAAYFLVTMIVGHLSTAWDVYEMGFLVRTGYMSPRLLRPILPIWQSMADNTAYKVLTIAIVLPIWGAFAVLAEPRFATTGAHLAWGIPATMLAAALNYLWGYNLALLAFWITRMDAVGQIWFGVSMLFGGRIAPLSILPEPLQWFAAILPFQWIIWFPSVVLMGQYDTTKAMYGVLAQLAWLVAGIITFKVLWRLAIKQYSAVGA
jgi:ABC-2 type transport system permease protein